MRGDAPSPDRAQAVTRLMNRFSAGETGVRTELMDLIYAELHALATAHMARESGAHTLQPTALVGEAYLRLVGLHDATWESRRQFYAMASRIMRSLLVDHARAKSTKKRGGAHERVSLDPGTKASESAFPLSDMLDLDEALTALSEVDGQAAQAVELRYFGGLSVREIAEALGLSVRTAERRLRAAFAWLRDALDGGSP